MVRRIISDEEGGGGVGTGGGGPRLLMPKKFTATWTHTETNPSAGHKGFRVVFFTGADPNDASKYVVAPVEVGPLERSIVQVVRVASSITMRAAVQALYHNGNESSWRLDGGAVVVDPDTVTVGTKAAVDAAQATATAAQAAADAALADLAKIASDGWLTKGEKPQAIRERDAFFGAAHGDMLARASAAGVSATAYDTAAVALDTYLNALTPALADATQDTAIVAATWTSKWATAYAERTKLQNAITAAAQATGNNAQSTATTLGLKGQAINRDPGCVNASMWFGFGGGSHTFVTIADGLAGNGAIQGRDQWVADTARFPVDPARTYRVRCLARNQAGNGIFYLAVVLETAAGANIVGDGTWWYYPALGAVPGAAWTPYAGVFGANTSKPIPANARVMTVGVILNYQGTVGMMQAQAIVLEDVTEAYAAQSGVNTINSDDILSRAKKPQVIKDAQEITSEQSGLDSQATSWGITAEKTSYDSAVSSLLTFLQNLGGSNPNWAYLDLTTDTSLGVGGGATLRARFAAVASARTTLQNAIAAKAQARAELNAAADANTKATNAQNAAVSAAASDAASKYLDMASYTNATPGAFIASGKPKLTAESFGVGPQYQYTNTAGGTPMSVNQDGSFSRSGTAPNTADQRWVGDNNHIYSAADKTQVYSARFRGAFSSLSRYGLLFNLEGSAFPGTNAKGLLLWRQSDNSGGLALYAVNAMGSYPASYAFNSAWPAEERLTVQWNNTLGTDGIRLRIFSNSTLVAAWTDAQITVNLGAAYAGAKAVGTYAALLLTDGTIKVDEILHGQNTTLIHDGIVQTRHLQAESVTTNLLASQAVLTKNLAVLNWDNLVPNPTGELAAASGPESAALFDTYAYYGSNQGYSNSRFVRRIVATGSAGSAYGAVYITNDAYNNPSVIDIPVNANDVYSLNCQVVIRTGTGTARIGVRWRLSNGTISFASNSPITTTTGQWVALTGLVQAPSNAVSMAVYIELSFASSGAYADFDQFYVRRALDAKVVVDGSITAKKLQIGAAKTSSIYLVGSSYNLTTGAYGTIRLDGVNHQLGGRGLDTVVIRRSDHAVLDSRNYDTYGSDAARTNMATWLNGLGSDVVVAIASGDAMGWNQALVDAINRCGGNVNLLNFNGRVPYALLGIPGSGKGGGYEVYTDAATTTTPAFINTFLVDGNIMGAQRAFSGSTVIDGGQVVAGVVKTANYAEDGYGKPTSGAGLFAGGTALKVAAGNLQVGSYIFSDYFFRILQGIDGGSSTGRVLYRGNIDPTVRGGAPNIAALTVTRRRWDTTLKVCRLELAIQPTAAGATDNLDAMRYAQIQLYRQSAAGTTATLTLVDTFPHEINDRSYGNFASDNAAANASRSTFWAVDAGVSSGVPAVLITLYNAYGPSAGNCYYAAAGNADGSLLVNNGTAWPAGITGATGGGGGGGGGTGGGGCPAPWVRITLASGLVVDAGDLYDGAHVVGVNDMTMAPAIGTVRSPRLIWSQRLAVVLEDGRAPEFSEMHRVALVDKGWTEVRHLQPGDVIVSEQPAIVKAILPKGLAEVVTFQVEGCATYLADGLLSHNLKDF